MTVRTERRKTVLTFALEIFYLPIEIQIRKREKSGFSFTIKKSLTKRERMQEEVRVIITLM
jgi:hypothetical protein